MSTTLEDPGGSQSLSVFLSNWGGLLIQTLSELHIVVVPEWPDRPHVYVLHHHPLLSCLIL